MSATTQPDPPAGAPAFIPLEANPELMSSLLRKLGLSAALQVHDVYSITEPELLAFIPRPALALLLVFPVSATYESARMAEDAAADDYQGKGPDEPVVWFRQTIRNACGLMGLLHAVANGPARGFIGECFILFFFFSLPFSASRLCILLSSSLSTRPRFPGLANPRLPLPILTYAVFSCLVKNKLCFTQPFEPVSPIYTYM
jgi:hypothetical protein